MVAVLVGEPELLSLFGFVEEEEELGLWADMKASVSRTRDITNEILIVYLQYPILPVVSVCLFVFNKIAQWAKLKMALSEKKQSGMKMSKKIENEENNDKKQH